MQKPSKNPHASPAMVRSPHVQAPFSGAAPRGRGRPRSEAAAIAVLEAAYRLSARDGLRGASIQAIADESKVSKVTIYKWWGSRLALLIDAFLRQTLLVLPLSEEDPPVVAVREHALRYVAALRGELGRVMMAVIAECMSESGNSALFVERYLAVRRQVGMRVIRRGQRDRSIASLRSASVLWDQIYGTIFYRYMFGLGPLDKKFVHELVASTFDGP